MAAVELSVANRVQHFGHFAEGEFVVVGDICDDFIQQFSRKIVEMNGFRHYLFAR